MIIDTLNEYADELSIITTTIKVTDVLDHGAAGETLGNELYLHASIGATAFAGSGFTVALQTDPDESFSGGNTVTLYTYTSAATAIEAGTELFRIRVPKGRLRYSKLVITKTTAAITAGTFNAFLSPSVQDSYDVV